MLASLLPVLESILTDSPSRSMAGTAESLGVAPGDGLRSLLSKMSGFSSSNKPSGSASSAKSLLGLSGTIQPFQSENELGEGLKKIEEILKQIRESNSQMAISQKSSDKRVQQFEDPSDFWYDPALANKERAIQARSQQRHADDTAELQRKREEFQARAAASLNPAAAKELAQRGNLLSAGKIGLAGQVAAQIPHLLAQSPHAQYAGAMADQLGPGGQIAKQAGSQAASSASSVLGKAGTGAAIGMSVAGPPGAAIGAVVGSLVGAQLEIAKLPGHIIKWSESLVESQRSLSMFNGELAQVFAKQEQRKIIRGMESGQRTSGSTKDLSHALDNLHDTLQPIADGMTIVTAKVLTPLVNAFTMVLNNLDKVIPIAMRIDKVAGSMLIALKALEKIAEAEKRANEANATSIGDSLLKDIQTHDVTKPRSLSRRR